MITTNRLKKLNKKLLPTKYLFSPEWMILGVNNVCNLHCKMCDVGTKTLDTNFATNLVGTHPINMPLELIKNIIDQTARYYPKTKLGYAFTEPLVYPHLIESIAYASSKNLFTSVTTNALTLKQKAEKLVNAGLNELYISLDGPQEIHNEIRGHKKSFQKAMEGIETLLNLNPNQTIAIFCVITEWNIGHLIPFLDQIKHLPLKQVGFMHPNFTPNSLAIAHNHTWSQAYPATISNVEEVTIDNFDLNILQNEVLTIKENNYSFPVTFSPDIISEEEINRFYNKPHLKIGRGCNDIYRNIMIKSDGSVIPAHGRCYNLTLGNLYNESLKEIWHSKVLQQLRNDLRSSGGLLPACNRCCSAF